jgi:hypothetical protein
LSSLHYFATSDNYSVRFLSPTSIKPCNFVRSDRDMLHVNHFFSVSLCLCGEFARLGCLRVTLVYKDDPRQSFQGPNVVVLVLSADDGRSAGETTLIFFCSSDSQ